MRLKEVNHNWNAFIVISEEMKTKEVEFYTGLTHEI